MRHEAGSLGGLLFLNALVPLLALTTGKSMVYDNERLLMHVFPFLAALAGMGFGWLVTRGWKPTSWGKPYAAPLPYLNEHAKPGDMIWVDPLSQNVMVYYQVHGRLRSDVKIAFPPEAGARSFPE